ncbi:MAG: hypothetical protein J5922_03540 [Clostridia bacterium]|nr:hypothetical protein [Clostridia bacterium]
MEGLITLQGVIIALGVGLGIGAIFAIYLKNVKGRTVRSLIESGAFSEKSAKTLDDIGLGNSFFAIWSCRKNSTLRRVITVLGSDEKSAKIDPAKDRIYIEEDKLSKAENLWGGKPIGVMPCVFALLLIAAVTVLCCYLVPWLLKSFADKF